MIDISNYKNIYFSSDFHFSHENVIKYCNRPFANVDEMNEAIMAAIDVAGKDDLLVFLGDFSMKFSAVEEFLPRIKSNILYISGNHCKSFEKIGKESKSLQPKARMMALNPRIIKISMREEILIGKQKVLLSHFPWRGDEDERHTEYIDKYVDYKPSRQDYPSHFLACGHRHFPPEKRRTPNSLDVGWDAWGRLVSIEEVLDDLH